MVGTGDMREGAGVKPLTYRGTTREGVTWRVDFQSGPPAVGETAHGTVSFEGEGHPAVKEASIALVARLSGASTSLDVGELIGGAISRYDDDDGDGIPTKTQTTVSRLSVVEARVQLAAPGPGSEVGSFEFAIPVDAPASASSRDDKISWNFGAVLKTVDGSVSFVIADVPMTLPRHRVADTPYLEVGALDSIVGGTTDQLEWSMEVEGLPLVPGDMLRCTFLVTSTERLRKIKPHVTVSGVAREKGSKLGQIGWIERCSVLSDEVDQHGRRRIRFEKLIPVSAFVTTGGGNKRFVATITLSIARWGLFGPMFERPIAIASPA